MFAGTCTLSLIPFFMGETKLEVVEIDDDAPSKDVLEDAPCVPVTSRSGATEQINSSLFYDTRNFSRGWSLSSLALGRLGELYGSQCILEMLERETCV